MAEPDDTDDPIDPRPIRDACIALHLQRAARAVNRIYDAALKPAGISAIQYSLLVAVARQNPPALGRLATEMSMDRTTMTANLKPLEARGLIVSRADPDDGRSRRLVLSPAGRAVLTQAIPLWRVAQERLGPTLSHRDDTLKDLRALADA